MIDDDKGFFTANKVMTVVINHGEIFYNDVRSWLDYSFSEQVEILSIIKKTISGKLGKIVTEYEFTKEEGNMAQDLLIRLKDSKFEDDELNIEFLDSVLNNVKYTGAYTLFVLNFTITFLNKKTDETEDITFLAGAFCPITLRNDGFVYNDIKKIIEKKIDSDRVLEKATDGFLFPTESDAEMDVNHVMYYNKKANTPNLSIIEDLLNCKYVMSAERQRINFWATAAKVLGDDLTYEMILKINAQLSDIVASSAAMSEAREIDCSDMQSIFEKCGVEEEALDRLGTVYEKLMGSRHVTMIASNLCDEKVNIKAGNTSINMEYRTAISKLSTEVVNGKKCLVIPLDSSDISVLGIETKC